VTLNGLTIVSGGQTGADRASLDFAIAHGLPHGGWCSLGRRAEDGPLHERYQMRETEGDGYRQRTKCNVADSDATPIFNIGELSDGSLATLRFAERAGKPVRVVALDVVDQVAEAKSVRKWLAVHGIAVLNTAGPRESKRPGVYQQTLAFLDYRGQVHLLP
jgi:hypothetical protein